MDNSRIPKQILYRELSEGTRNVGRPKLASRNRVKRPRWSFLSLLRTGVWLPRIEWGGELLFS